MKPTGDKAVEHSVEQSHKLPRSASGGSASARPALQSAAGQLSASLGELLNTEFHVDPEGASEQTWRQLASSLEDPTCRWTLDCSGRTGWLTLAGPVLHAAVDCLLGGTGQVACRRAELTSIEHRVAGRLAEKVSEAIGGATGMALKLNSDSAEPGDPQQLGQQGCLLSFRVSLSGHSGTISLGLPTKLGRLLTDAELEKNLAAGSSHQGPAATGPVELSVVADAADLPAEHLADLKAGDLLVTDADCEGELEVRIDGKPSHSAKLGSRNGKRAISIVRPLDED